MKLEKWKISTLHKFISRFQEMQKDLSEFTQEEQEFILNMHNEGFTLQHCIRWGLQAIKEIQDEVDEE